MLAEMSWSQLKEWMQYYNLEPFGEDRDDIRSAIAACGVANVVIASQGGKSRVKPDLFMPQVGKGKKSIVTSTDRKPLTNASDWRRMKSMAKVLGSRGKLS